MEKDIPSCDMTRSQIYLTAEERQFFRKIAYEQEITMSEAIREVLDKHIEKGKTHA